MTGRSWSARTGTTRSGGSSDRGVAPPAAQMASSACIGTGAPLLPFATIAPTSFPGFVAAPEWRSQWSFHGSAPAPSLLWGKEKTSVSRGNSEYWLMGSLSIWHWLIVILVVVLLFGRNKISDLMGDVAKGVKSFKQGLADDDAPPRPLESKASVEQPTKVEPT